MQWGGEGKNDVEPSYEARITLNECNEVRIVKVRFLPPPWSGQSIRSSSSLIRSTARFGGVLSPSNISGIQSLNPARKKPIHTPF